MTASDTPKTTVGAFSAHLPTTATSPDGASAPLTSEASAPAATEAAAGAAPAATSEEASNNAAKDEPAAPVAASTSEASKTAGGDVVLITGGTGLIALHCIHQCLLAGYRVRTTVRSKAKASIVTDAIRVALDDPELTEPKDKPAETSQLLERLTFAETNLLDDKGWDEAVAGAKYILHVASPFPATTPKDEVKELIQPAVGGTMRVLKAALKARQQGGADGAAVPERIVVTSSAVAVMYDGSRPAPGRIYDETDWSDVTKQKGYGKSKTMAERAAWDFMEKEGNAVGLELAVVSPVGVFGPPLRPKDRSSTTVDAIRQMLAGKIPATPRIGLSVVDVRDVASLHLLAMTRPEAKGQRYLCTTTEQSYFLLDYAAILRAAGGKDGALTREFGAGVTRKVPSRNLPDWLLSVAGLAIPAVREFKNELGVLRNGTSKKAREQLGWSPRSKEETILSTARSLLKAKAV